MYDQLPDFFPSAGEFSLVDLIEATGTTLYRPAADAGERGTLVPISTASSISMAKKKSVTFLVSQSQQNNNNNNIEATEAGCVITTTELAPLVPKSAAVLTCTSPRLAFISAVLLLHPTSNPSYSQIFSSGDEVNKNICNSVKLEDASVLVHSSASVGEGVQIGSGTIIEPGAVIGRNVTIGRNCIIGANSVVQVACIGNSVIVGSNSSLGGIGFGLEVNKTGTFRVPHIGSLIVQDRVEIGDGCTIDRATLEHTVIGENTKIDNIVHVAHNVIIGRNCLICGGCSIAGSAKLQDYVRIGGMVGIMDHITVGTRSDICGSSMVVRNVPDYERWVGTPARRIGRTDENQI